MDEQSTPAGILQFWRDAGRDRWFSRDNAFDELCRARFMRAYDNAAAGSLRSWENTPEGSLALVILLDQMPRNMFREEPQTWATDPMARAVADRALANGFDRTVDPELRAFFYLPFMHAEDLAAQERSVALYEAHGDPENLRFARHHRDIVARFGRFPHRNAILGRESTPEELAFLETDPFRG